MGRYISRSMLALLLAATASIAASGAPEQGGGDLTIGAPHRMPRAVLAGAGGTARLRPGVRTGQRAGSGRGRPLVVDAAAIPVPLAWTSTPGAGKAQVQAAAHPRDRRAGRVAGAGAGEHRRPGHRPGGRPDVRPTRSSPAAASGGVWRSTDAGPTFSSAWDPTLTPSIGALAISQHRHALRRHGRAQPGRRQRHLPRQRASTARPTTARRGSRWA